MRVVVREAPEWSRLFSRYEGWTGADGIYAIPLSGHEGPGRADRTKTMFVFSDTFIGKVDPHTLARRDSRMVNNTLALLDGGRPDPQRLRFIWGSNGDGSRRAVFTPTTARAREFKRSYYWLQDGVASGGNVYVFTMLVIHDPSGAEGFKFKTTGVALIKIPIRAGLPDLRSHTQMDTPLFHVDRRRKLFFGAGIMPNTVEAGAPRPDGHVYVYGRYQVRGRCIELAVARVKAERFEDFGRWRFWDGRAWSRNIEDAAPLGRGGPELSVTPIAGGPLEGKYLLVSMHMERDLYIRVGSGPAGPFGPRINIYRTREPDAGRGVYTYNAKAHPSLSGGGGLLITYNVNTTEWKTHMRNGHVYRPRFLRVRFERAK